MPRKRKPDFTDHSVIATSQTKENHSKQLAADAKRQTQRRANETKVARSQRQASDANRQARAKSNESEERRLQRQAMDTERHTQSRSNEGQAKRARRQVVDSEHQAQRRRAVREIQAIGLKVALAQTDDLDESGVQEHYCGPMDQLCRFCNAKHFKGELPPDKKFTSCCRKGKVHLAAIRVPHLLQELLTGEHHRSKNFFENIRNYNSALAFASMGAQVRPPPGHGPYCFRVHGQVYHQTGPLHPLVGEQRKFAQIYILDTDKALTQRMGILANQGCIPELMNELGELMREINPFAEAYKMMQEVELEEYHLAKDEGRLIHDINMAIVTNRGEDQRRYNACRVNEVAAIFCSGDGAPPYNRDIRIHSRSEHRSQQVAVTDPNLDPMTYPILFPHGDEGWKFALPYGTGAGKVSQLQHYAYRLAIRDEFSPILRAGKLTQQYCVDAYCKIESNRLNYIKLNQKALRTDKYSALVDHFSSTAQTRGLKPGKLLVLPSSFQGSPRAMTQHFQDAMAIVRKFGKPDLFITMTCNKAWKEITEHLNPGERCEMRPDLVARVFKLKLTALLDDVMNKHIFGVPVAKIHVIEFQKRGLPHAHILVILRSEDKPKTAEIIDEMISAEFPDPEKQPRLYEIVKTKMIHGPCGKLNPNSPCMVEEKCSKRFPKSYADVTNENVDGFPLYRRRNAGTKYPVGKYNLSNLWVVPYNPFLLLKYNCHINVEVCSSIEAIRYLFKYVYKGHDCATIEVQTLSIDGKKIEHDEIVQHLDTRYVSSPEALWRIFEFRMHDQSLHVERLTVHLPKDQPVVWLEGMEAQALAYGYDSDNTLTAWFKLNQCDINAREYFYHDIPEHYVFHKKDKEWRPRKQGGENTIGRMYSISPNQGDIFYLRLLLLHVKGAMSFNDIRTVDGKLCATFKEAAIERKLLADDKEWDNCLNEAVLQASAKQFRQLFALICVYCSPSNPSKLWTDHKTKFVDDYVCQECASQEAEYKALKDVEDTLEANSRTLAKFNLVLPNCPIPLQREVTNYKEAKAIGIQMANQLNEMQQVAFDKIMTAVIDDSHPERLFFLDGPGGTGKTFTYKCLHYNVTGLRLSVTNCASTGIAASLLPFGNTYHSTFGLGPNFHSETVANITTRSAAGRALRETKVIVIDECTMTPHYALDVIDRLLADLTNDDRLFGGKVILLGGDFRQTLPIVRRGNRVKTVEACLKSGRLWHHFTTLTLCENVRVSNDDKDFRAWLLKLGNGELTNSDGFDEDIIEIPQEFIEDGDLIDSIFGKTLSLNEVDSFKDKAILTPKNKDVHDMNNKVLERLEGTSRTYPSADSILAEDTDINPADFPVEFLNSLEPGGCPVHNLTLKVGAIVMLLRNLNKSKGLCNGTRAIVREMHDNFIIVEIMTGRSKGEQVYIPRIDIVTTELYLPFQLRRRQFPVMLAFVMTINKAQGQSIKKVGIYLPQSVFSHGQLYVAFSRSTSKSGVRVRILTNGLQGRLIKRSKRVFTRNVVYREVFGRPAQTHARHDLNDAEFIQLTNNLLDQCGKLPETFEWNESDQMDDIDCGVENINNVSAILSDIEITNSVDNATTFNSTPIEQPTSSSGNSLGYKPGPTIYEDSEDDL